MGLIVCATRGGEGSRVAQLIAIETARKAEHRLIFLYVVDQEHIAGQDNVLQAAVRAEFHWLGQVLLHIARQRAEAAGLSARIAIRDGIVSDEIEKFLKEQDASLLVLGAPRDTSPVFGDDAIEQFASRIERETGVPVSVVRPEDYETILDETPY